MRKFSFYILKDLLILTIFCLIVFQSNQTKPVYTYLKIYWWDSALKLKYPDFFNYDFPPERSYLKIVLTGNSSTDKIKLDFAGLYIKDLLERKDTTAGVNFKFSDSSTYGEFVYVRNLMELLKVRVFLACKNDFWALYYKGT